MSFVFRLHLVACVAVASFVSLTTPAVAHELRPAIVDLTFEQAGRFELSIETNVEALLAEIGKQHSDTNESPNAKKYNSLRMLSSDALAAKFREFSPGYINQLQLLFDKGQSELDLEVINVPEVGDIELARISQISFSGRVPTDATSVTFAYVPDYGDSVLRVVTKAGQGTNNEPVSFWLPDGQPSETIALDKPAPARSLLSVLKDYVVIGFTHIVPKGLDHILFVLGIFFLSLKWRPLLYQVTAFTVAHTITLGLSIYGVLSLSPNIVEPLIALSIVYVAVENIVSARLQPWRIALVFAFGLLHGMGFAGVLTEIGLPRSEYLPALISFNVGVELGQLAVILMAFVLVGWLRNRDWYRSAVVIPCSLIIAAIGLFWTVERTLLT